MNVSKDKLRSVIKEIEHLCFLQTDEGASSLLDLCDGAVRAAFVKSVTSAEESTDGSLKRVRSSEEQEGEDASSSADFFSKLFTMITTEILALIEAFGAAKWRTRVDIESITKRRAFLRAFSTRLSRTRRATESDAKQLYQVLMGRFSSVDETPFFHWLTHNTVACVTTNEHISSIANRQLLEDNEKVHACNVQLAEKVSNPCFDEKDPTLIFLNLFSLRHC
jgi:hypothetical protein